MSSKEFISEGFIVVIYILNYIVAWNKLKYIMKMPVAKII
jgi:hypothetical protein